MQNISETCDLIKNVTELLDEYESITRCLLECDIDDITSYVEKRQHIVEKIDVVTKRIHENIGDDQQAMDAFRNICSISELPDELKEIFELRQQMNVHLWHIHEIEIQVTDRIRIEKENLLKKIKSNNSGQNAKAAKYVNGGLNTGQNVFFPENKKLI